MKDTTPDPKSFMFRLCPYSAQCVRWLDEIDSFDPSLQVDPLSTDEEMQSYELIQQLALHLQTCEMCMITVAKVRRQRGYQRRLLTEFLADGEHEVTTTVSSIMQAVSREQQQPISGAFQGSDDELDVSEPFRLLDAYPAGQPKKEQKPVSKISSRVRYFSVVAMAAVMILASVNVLHYWAEGTASSSKSIPGTQTAATTPAVEVKSVLPSDLTESSSWTSVVLSRLSDDGKSKIIENYDPADGKMVQLIPSCCSSNTEIDEISDDGHNLAYHSYNAQTQQTTYSLLTGQQYIVNGLGTNAIWGTNGTDLYVAVKGGAGWQIDTNTNAIHQLAAPLQATQLVSFRDDYLYFMRGNDLYRMNVAANTNKSTRVLTTQANEIVSVDPDVSQVYYTKLAQDGQRDTYVVNGDGTDPQLLAENSTPVGYDNNANDALLLVQQDKSDNRFKLLKTNAKSLCDDVNVASDGVPICSASLALSPTGDMLVAEVGYDNGSHKIVAMNCLQHTSQQLALPTSDSSHHLHVQLLGWDKFQVR